MDYDYYEKKCFENSFYHEKCKEYYSTTHTTLTMIIIAITASTSISNNITAIYRDSIYISNYISVGYSLILYVNVVITSIQHFLKYEELAEKHHSTASKYKHLYNITLSENIHIEEFKNTMIKEFELLYTNSPDIPDWIIKKFSSELVFPNMHLEVNVVKNINDDIDAAIDYQMNRFNK